MCRLLTGCKDACSVRSRLRDEYLIFLLCIADFIYIYLLSSMETRISCLTKDMCSKIYFDNNNEM